MGIPYLWTVLSHYPNKLIGEYDFSGADRFLLWESKSLGPEFGISAVRIEVPLGRLSKIDDLYNNSSFPLVSERLRAFLTERIPGDVQFIPTRVIATDGETDAFMLLNVLRSVHAIDHDNTSFMMMTVADPPYPYGFKKLAHLSNQMGNHGLAREAEYKAHLLVADWLADELIASDDVDPFIIRYYVLFSKRYLGV